MGKGQLIVIGGGAAGLAGAVAAATQGAAVTLLERADRVGKKLLRTGNGRCNLTNIAAAPEAYNAPAFVAPVLETLPCAALRDFFRSLGLETYKDGEGRVYPVSDTATSVLDVLRLCCEELGVEVRCGFDAVSITPGFSVKSRNGEKVTADAVLVTTGGGTKLLGGLGHSITPFQPVLCPLKTDTAPIRGLSGLRAKCRATLLRDGAVIAAEDGELLFRDYGVSGIAVFDLSRYAQAGDVLSIDFLPQHTQEMLCKLLTQRRRLFPGRSREQLLTGLFHSRINAAILRRADSTDPEALCGVIKDFSLSVEGPGEPEQAQLTRGGAALGEFDPATLQSRLHRGLYAAGETLDIDGKCGGYNLHWAFASGICAARAAVEALL